MRIQFRWICRFWGFRPWRRHSLVLIVAGFVFAGVGIAYVLAEPNEARQKSLAIILHLAPMDFWGSIFILAGFLVVISSKWPHSTETWGYTILTGLSSGWSAVFLMGIIFYGSPLSNLIGGLIWGLMGFMWWAISGLVNPSTLAVLNNELE